MRFFFPYLRRRDSGRRYEKYPLFYFYHQGAYTRKHIYQLVVSPPPVRAQRHFSRYLSLFSAFIRRPYHRVYRKTDPLGAFGRKRLRGLYSGYPLSAGTPTQIDRRHVGNDGNYTPVSMVSVVVVCNLPRR